MPNSQKPLVDVSKICVDCKRCRWASAFTGDGEQIHNNAWCVHEDAQEAEPSPVVGLALPTLCREARAVGGPCGPHAALFEHVKGAR